MTSARITTAALCAALAWAPAALAQQAPDAPPAAARAQAPVTPPPAARAQAAPQPAPAASEINHEQIAQVKMMEGVLAAAVRTGAEELGHQMQIAEPGSIIVTGSARARGFVLDGYGVFFDVDVPMMKQSVIWSTRMLLREQQRAQLQNFIAANPDSPARRQAQLMLQQLERASGPIAMPPLLGPPAPEAAAPGAAAAQAVNDGGATPAAVTAPVPATAPSVLTARDPNELYTESVKSALVDAMIQYSGALDIGPDEWLTVAARDAEGPLTPGELYDAATLVLRIKGSDLLAFATKQITKDEARRRVQVKNF